MIIKYSPNEAYKYGYPKALVLAIIRTNMDFTCESIAKDIGASRICAYNHLKDLDRMGVIKLNYMPLTRYPYKKIVGAEVLV